MHINVRKALLPENPKLFRGFQTVRLLTFGFLMVIVIRSGIHLFSPDGGAESIAGIDTSVEGGGNIVALFHQWGAIQIILAALLLVLFFYYKGLTPLVIGFLALDAPMRAIAGQMGKVESAHTPPGEILNWPAFFLMVMLFVFSLVEKKAKT